MKYHILGVCYFLQGKYDKAKDTLLKAIRVNEKCRCYGWLARIYYQERDFERALAFARESKKSTNSRNSLCVIGLVLRVLFAIYSN